ncbi:MAG: 3-hydroxyacyl-CoA dehydrogenase family protein [Gemmatimonadales bacterium]
MKRIAVIGAGTMGHGIAQVAAMAGYEVVLTDSNAEVLAAAPARIEKNLQGGVSRGKISDDDAKAAIARITTTSSIEEAVGNATFAIEAVLEDIAIKQDLFRKLDRLAEPNAVLATNTSSLSVSQIASATDKPGRVVGMHFFNPVHIMKLVEIIAHPDAGTDAVARTRALAEEFGKQPIVVRDTPGFASSRLGVVLGLEAMRMVEQEVASPEDIDKAMVLGYGHPMGPLEVSDLVGLDIRLAIADYLHSKLGAAQYAAPDILRSKVQAGELGKKTGKGFYDWPQ